MVRFVLTTACLLWFVVSAQAQGLPGNDADLAFDDYMQAVDLEAKGLVFVYKGRKQEGSSLGFHVAEPGRRKVGTFIPYNSSSDPEAEVVSYRLARFLGVSKTYNPVAYYELGPLASARFKVLMRKHGEVTPDRIANRAHILAEFAEHPKKLFGIFRQRPEGKLYQASSLGLEGRPNLAHPLMLNLRAERAQPTGKLVTIPGVRGLRKHFPAKPSERDDELSRQLSNIFVIDQLMGQWDRFWRNLEAAGDEQGRLYFMARDNGGANIDDGWEWHEQYVQTVSRYDRAMIAKLKELQAFLAGKAPKAGDFTSIEDWKQAVGFRKASSFSNFTRKLDLLVGKTLPAREQQYGDKVYFAMQ